MGKNAGDRSAAPRTSRRVEATIDPPITLFKARHRERLQDPELIDLSQAVPSYPPPPPVSETFAARARAREAHLYSPDPGLPECREAIAADLRRRHGAEIVAEQILITPGANAAFHFAVNALLDPGEPAALLTPYYFNHAMSISLHGSSLVELPWGESIPLDLAEAAGARLLALVTPGNPTGRSISAEEIAAALSWSRRRGVALVIDETYREFPAAGGVDRSALSFPEWSQSAVVLGSFSKSLAVTGHRVGYLCAAPELIRHLLKVQDTAVICAPRLAQEAVTAALGWEGLDAWLASRRTEIAERVRAFAEAIDPPFEERDPSRTSPFTLEHSGAFFAWLAHRPVEGAEDDAVADRLVREAGVLALPGDNAGALGRHRIRVAVGNAEPPRLLEAARRMRQMAL